MHTIRVCRSTQFAFQSNRKKNLVRRRITKVRRESVDKKDAARANEIDIFLHKKKSFDSITILLLRSGSAVPGNARAGGSRATTRTGSTAGQPFFPDPVRKLFLLT